MYDYNNIRKAIHKIANQNFGNLVNKQEYDVLVHMAVSDMMVDFYSACN